MNNPAFPNGCIPVSTAIRSNGDLTSVVVGITNMKANNYETDWTLNIRLMDMNMTGGNPINLSDL